MELKAAPSQFPTITRRLLHFNPAGSLSLFCFSLNFVVEEKQHFQIPFPINKTAWCVPRGARIHPIQYNESGGAKLQSWLYSSELLTPRSKREQSK